MKQITLMVPDDCPEIPQGSIVMWFPPGDAAAAEYMPEIVDTRADPHGESIAPDYVVFGFGAWGFICSFPQLIIDWHSADMRRMGHEPATGALN